MALRTVGVRLTAEIADYQRKMRQAGQSTREFVGETNKAAKSGHLDTVANGAGVAGLAIAGIGAYAIKSAADFDKAMSGVRAATHASTKDIAALRQAALQAGKDTSFSATEAAKGITELSKAGISTADVLGGGLKGALALAAAGQMDVGEAAETAASAMTQFRLSGKDVPHIADLLAAGAGKAQGSVHDMGMALSQSGLVASQFGLTVEDTTGTLAAFASAGLTGSDAGTSFKTMLVALANPTKETKNLMKELGINAYDAAGNFVGITQLAEQLRTKLGGLTQAQRDAALAQIFGTDAIRSANVLYRQGASGIQGWINKVNDAGYAAETAKIQTDNLAGDLERLKGSLETLAIESGSGANRGLRTLAQGAEAAVDAFSGLPGWVQQTVTVLGGVSGASLLAAAGFIKMRSTTRDFMAELEAMGPRGTAAATGLSRLGSVAGKLSLVGIAAVGVYEGFKLFSDWAETRTGPTKANIDLLTASIKEFAATGKVTGELASKYGANLQNIGRDVDALTQGMKDLERAQADVAAGLSDPSVYANWNPVNPQALQRLKDLDTALTALVNNGGASQARIMLQRLAASGSLTADQFQRLMGQLPQYSAAASNATVANTGLAKGFGDAKANAQSLKGTLDSAVTAGQKLTDVWNQLHGALVGTDKAMLAANNSIQDVKKSFHENKNAIDGNSTAALKNRIAVGDAAKAAVEAAQAKFEETNSVAAANRVYNSYVGQLRKTLGQAGLTQKQIDSLTASYIRMPDSVATKVSTTGVPGVQKQLNQLLVKQYALARGLSTSAANAAVQKDLDRNRQRGYHAGGWTGPGGERDEAGVVHADEFVIRKQSRRRIEAQAPGLLEEMNATGQAPGYAAGGRVQWPFPVSAAKTRIPPWSQVAAAVAPDFGRWPSSPGAQRGDSGVWRRILALVKASGIPYDFGNAYRPGDPKWHGSGRAIDFMGYNQDRLAQFFMSRQGSVLELIHRTKNRDYGITRGHYNAMPTQWPLHRNHLHIAMKNGGTIAEPIMGVGASGRTYSFGENYQPERVVPNWQPAAAGAAAGITTTINLSVALAAGANMREAGRQISEQLGSYLAGGGKVVVRGATVLG